jgi:hypothetical protein
VEELTAGVGGAPFAMNPESRPSHGTLTLIAIGVVSYIFADLCHEVFGHALVCLVTGGKILVLTSVFFRSEPGSRLVDAAGPTMNFLAGALLWIVLTRSQKFSPPSRLFLVFAAAFNFFWGAGYFVYSGVANEGDWALVIRGLPPPMFWRAVLLVLGVVSYFLTMRLIVRALAEFAGRSDGRRLVFIPYIAAGAAACLAALFDRRDLSGALAGAVRETFLTNVVLFAIPGLIARSGLRPSRVVYVARSFGWLAGSALILLVFLAVMGRGYSPG